MSRLIFVCVCVVLCLVIGWLDNCRRQKRTIRSQSAGQTIVSPGCPVAHKCTRRPRAMLNLHEKYHRYFKYYFRTHANGICDCGGTEATARLLQILTGLTEDCRAIASRRTCFHLCAEEEWRNKKGVLCCAWIESCVSLVCCVVCCVYNRSIYQSQIDLTSRDPRCFVLCSSALHASIILCTLVYPLARLNRLCFQKNKFVYVKS